MTATLGAAPAGAASSTDGYPAPLSHTVTWHYGPGFDACAAPPVETMRAWLASPYRSVGIYIGGASRACAQNNLTASWLREVAGMGWKVQPIYVGPQAQCTSFRNRIPYGQEWELGRANALDAIESAKRLGLGSGSDIYYDMEGYAAADAACSGSVRAFLSSWTQTIREGGYRSGVYSSVGSGIRDLANGYGQPGYVAPDRVWIARWGVQPNVYGHQAYGVGDALWSPYQRSHQYTGGHWETHGGVSLWIDSNVHDTDMDRGSPTGQVDTLTAAPHRITASGWALEPDSAGPIIVQMFVDGRDYTQVLATQSRPDVGTAFPYQGPDHGYTLSIDAAPGDRRVCVYAVNTGYGSDRTLRCSTVTVPTGDPFGQVDDVTATPGAVTVRGWAVDPESSQPIAVQVYLDGRDNVVAMADQARPDVASAVGGAGPAHGYQVTIPAAAGQHRVCVYAINTGYGTSQQLACSTVIVP